MLVWAGVPGRQMAKHCSPYSSSLSDRESTSRNGVCSVLSCCNCYRQVIHTDVTFTYSCWFFPWDKINRSGCLLLLLNDSLLEKAERLGKSNSLSYFKSFFQKMRWSGKRERVLELVNVTMWGDRRERKPDHRNSDWDLVDELYGCILLRAGVVTVHVEVITAVSLVNRFIRACCQCLTTTHLYPCTILLQVKGAVSKYLDINH